MREAVLSLPAFSDQPSLIKRLAVEFIEATRDLRANPRQYLASAMGGDAFGGYRRKALFRFGLAIGIVLYAIFFGVTLVLWSVNARQTAAAGKDNVPYVGSPLRPLFWLPKSDKQAHGGGGGGGGHEAQTLASQGAPPPFAAETPIMAPTTRPTIQPPALPEIEKLLGDPSHNQERDDLIPTGLPNGVPGPPSDGPGRHGGIGSGDDGGVGPGSGPGFGPGDKGGEGGSHYRGPSGKTGDAVTAVDTKPIALNLPRPNYTEEARKNKIQGTVRARVLVSSDGLVKQVTIARGLPDGLNEEAIRAVFQIRFQAATKGGRTVAYWTIVEVDFNLR